jgi:hypothetical protein
MTPPEPKKRKIGFLVEEKAARYGVKRSAYQRKRENGLSA